MFTSERGAPFTTAGFARHARARGEAAKLAFKAHPHMLRHACGFALANKGHDTRALQAYLGHRNIQHTVRYTELSPVGSRTSGADDAPRRGRGPRRGETQIRKRNRRPAQFRSAALFFCIVMHSSLHSLRPMATTLNIRLPAKEAASLARIAKQERRTRTEILRAYIRWLGEATPKRRRAFLAKIAP